MKLLYLSSLYYPQAAASGIEKIAQVLAEGMAARGHRVSVLTLCNRQDAATSCVNGVRVIRLPIRNIYQPSLQARPHALRMIWHLMDMFNIPAARAIGRVIDQEGPDLVHTHNVSGFSAAVWPEVRRRRLPCVHTLHDYYLLCGKVAMFKQGRNCERMCTLCSCLTLPRRKSVGCLSAVVGVSQFVLEKHQRVSALRTVPVLRVIHNGLPVAPDGSETEPARPGPTRLGYLGRLDESKGVELLLVEFQSLRESTDYELLIAGSGKDGYVEILRNRSPGQGLRFVGFVDPNAFLKQIDLLIVPSLYHEPFGLVVLEALARGVAVIGARRGGIPELVRDRDNGMLFEPTLPGDLGRAVTEAVRLGLASPGVQARIANSVSHLTLAGMCEQYEQLYGDVQAG